MWNADLLIGVLVVTECARPRAQRGETCRKSSDNFQADGCANVAAPGDGRTPRLIQKIYSQPRIES